jgi:hypothetical protein
MLADIHFEFSNLWLSIVLLLLPFGPLITVACTILALGAIPVVSATPETGSFPNIPFTVLSNFVKNQLSPNITLAMVLTVMFSLTENTDLLNLHAQQQHPISHR